MPLPALGFLAVWLAESAVAASVRAGIAVALAWLSRIVFSRAGAWIATALVAMGIGFASHQFAVQPILDQIIAHANGAGDAVAWIAYLNFDKAITMIASTYAARATIQGARLFLSKRA